MIRRAMPYLVFPFVMCGGLATTLLLPAHGFDTATAALIAVLIFGFVLIPVLERLLPYRPDWNHADGDLATDVIHMTIGVAIPKLWTPVQVWVLITITGLAAEAAGSSLWPAHWHWLPGLCLMLVIAEFGRYWVHVAAHKLPILWRLHAVHHSPNRLYFLNANRFHPLEKLLFQIPEVAPFIILGTPPGIIALYFTFNGLHGLMQHSNIRVKLGPLNYIFSMTELHRWHHSQLISESDKNFGNNLILWDLVFGTYFNPQYREVDRIGLLNPEYPKRWWQQMLAPFAASDISKPLSRQTPDRP